MAKKLGQRRKIMLTELSCKAEIAQFNDASFGDENIFRLHDFCGGKMSEWPRLLHSLIVLILAKFNY